MRAVCWHDKLDVRVESVPEPKILNPRDAIVRVSATAICGSDLHLYGGFVPGMVKGDILGHEFMGEVVDLGPGVKNLEIGERVVVPFPIACGNCFFCQKAMFSLCENSNPNAAMAEKLWGYSPCGIYGYSHLLGGYAGGQAEYVRVPFADVGPLKVPAALSDEQVLFLSDILPTGYMGAEMAEVGPGDTVVVFGCGPVGTFAQMSAILRGAARVIAVDLDDGRLERARQLGCDAVNPSKQNLGEKVLEWTDGLGADASIEAVGRADLITQAAMITRPGGRIAVIGVLTDPTATLPWFLMFMKNLTLKTGLVNPQNFIPRLLPLVATNRLDPTVIISHRLPLSDGPNGYEIFAGHKDNVLKVVLKP
jgi:threonine dehydrogenase-like Zn-dependent dehydrogenase